MDVIAGTACGRVRGRVEDGVAVFLGIPYAAPPFGPRRFRAPVHAEPWTGLRDATRYGPTAPKPPCHPPLDRLLPDPDIPGDDCLNLNVWTPQSRDGLLPVMVWIHGGSLRNGSSSLPVYDGHAFARDGVVFVSVNYRLGIEGFGVFPDAPDNRGLLDQLAALTWVQDNIARFGGDPGNVTVFGESGVAALLTSPKAEGLVRRAILQSGPPQTVSRTQGAKVVRSMAKEMGVPATALSFSVVDRRRLLEAQFEVTRKNNPLVDGPGFAVVADDVVVPSDPGRVTVELLVGTNREEYRLWFVPTGALDRITAAAMRAAMLRYRIPSRVARLYQARRAGARPGEVLGAMTTDKVLRAPLARLAGRAPKAHVYEFAWPSPVMDLRACHGLELGFVFDTLRHCEALTGPGAPQPLADAMHRAWVDFATTGDPGWAAWDDTRPVMVFDAPESGVVLAPRDEELRSWPLSA
jgi:para-nitrobenzyl esterase